MSDDGATARTDPWTVGSVLRWATDDFRARGLDSPRLDAELLLGKVLGADRVRLIVDSQRALLPSELAAYRDLIRRRRKAEPVAYILGTREFYGMPFRVDPRVLVPRPETELLVEVALDRTEARHLHGEALDLCTGSGCVAIAFARRRPTWRVTGTDVSPGAVEVARDNAQRLGATWNTAFVESDMDEEIDASIRFDLVTANPPYIPSADLEALMPDVRDHEPHLALDGGEDGLEMIRRISSALVRRLHPGGVLVLEVGNSQADDVVQLLSREGIEETQIRKDYAGVQRIVSGRLRSAVPWISRAGL